MQAYGLASSPGDFNRRKAKMKPRFASQREKPLAQRKTSAQIAAVGVIQKMQTQGQIFAAKFLGQRLEGIRSGDATPSRAVKGHVTRGRNRFHAGHAAIFHDYELN